MYTASGGYYYSGSSSIQKKPTLRFFGHFRILQLTVFLTFFILSFVFGAVMHAYATNDTPLTTIPLGSNPLYETHTVDSGQTLWFIAKQYVPTTMDIRDYIDELIELNQLDTNVLFVGQRLLIPTI
jgi:LysM repeat protein